MDDVNQLYTSGRTLVQKPLFRLMFRTENRFFIRTVNLTITRNRI